MEGSGSATIRNTVHPKNPEEEETSQNRNRIIISKRLQTKELYEQAEEFP